MKIMVIEGHPNPRSRKFCEEHLGSDYRVVGAHQAGWWEHIAYVADEELTSKDAYEIQNDLSELSKNVPEMEPDEMMADMVTSAYNSESYLHIPDSPVKVTTPNHSGKNYELVAVAVGGEGDEEDDVYQE